LESREDKDFSGRHNVEILGFSVGENFHHKDCLFECSLHMRLSLTVTSWILNTQLAFIKSSQRIIRVKKRIIECRWFFSVSMKILEWLDPNSNRINFWVISHHELRHLLTECHLIWLPPVNEAPVDQSSSWNILVGLWIHVVIKPSFDELS
jgi:hypothetical protein